MLSLKDLPSKKFGILYKPILREQRGYSFPFFHNDPLVTEQKEKQWKDQVCFFRNKETDLDEGMIKQRQKRREGT